MTAVTLFGIITAAGARLHDLVREVVVAPQILLNVRTERADVLDLADVREAIVEGEAALGGSGRLFIRASGTEPLIRVMAEGNDAALVEQVAARVAARIEKEIARLA
jgi:phosphoglucosamine mutase